MEEEKSESKVVFLLGAGASIKAGVPDTINFVKDFVKHIRKMGDQAKTDTVNKIIKKLQEWKKKEIDIELLLEALVKLKDRYNEPLLQFFDNKDENFILRGYSEKEPIINDLKDFIKEKAIVSEDKKIYYFQPLLDFIRKIKLASIESHLDIISLNYDTCIEHFCDVYRLTYKDGFDDGWNIDTFDAKNADICLYKLHGSVTWYRTDRGDYIKLPIDTRKLGTSANKVPLISGGHAESLMLYPMQKLDYAEPVLELLTKVKHILESECEFLIVVGYSFRDDHIRRIIFDAARKNKDMHIIFISPDAYKIYFNKLKYYDIKKKIPSHLDGRVVCLPVEFENVFENLRIYYMEELKSGLKEEKYLINERLKDRNQSVIPFTMNLTQFIPAISYTSTINHFLNALHYEKAEKLFDEYYYNKEDSLYGENHLKLKLNYYYKMAVYGKKIDDSTKAAENFKYFFGLLRKILISGIQIEFEEGSKRINLIFNMDFNGHSEKIYPRQMNIESALSELINSYSKDTTYYKNIEEITKYLKYFENGLSLQDYIDSEPRKNKPRIMAEIKKISEKMKIKTEKTYKENIESKIKEIEAEIIKDFFPKIYL